MHAILRAWLSLLLSGSILTGGWGHLAPQDTPFDTLILVNRQHKAPVMQPELVLPDIEPQSSRIVQNLYLQPIAARALEELFAAAKADGHVLVGVSGYRSAATQKAIYDRRMEEAPTRTKKYVAPSGYSEHQTGLVMDIGGHTTRNMGLVESFADTPEGQWVAEHAHEHGFIIRYQKGWEAITGYNYEPWHLRYVGKEHARVMFEQKIPLETYVQRLTELRWALYGKPVPAMLQPVPEPTPEPTATPAL